MDVRFRGLLSIAAMIAVIGLLPTPSRGEDPFEILTMTSLSGPAAFVGQKSAKALVAIEGYVNRTGGIHGRPIKIVIQDDQTNPAIATQIMSQFLAKKPAIVVGGLFAQTCYASAALLKDDGPVLYCYASGVQGPTGGWIYTTGYYSRDMQSLGLRYFRERGLTKLALVTTTDANGQDADKGIAELLARPENRGFTLVAHEHMGVADISVAAQIERIKSAGAQSVIAWVGGTPFGTFVRNYRDSGLAAPVLGSTANLVYAQLESYKAVWPTAAPIMFVGIPPVAPEVVTDPAVKRALTLFGSVMKTQNIDRADTAEAIAWDMMLIIVDAFRQRGTNATPSQVRDYINSIRAWPGIYGRFDYQASPQRGVQSDTAFIVRWDPNADRFLPVTKQGGAPLK